jgi:hypothetical protein
MCSGRSFPFLATIGVANEVSKLVLCFGFVEVRGWDVVHFG